MGSILKWVIGGAAIVGIGFWVAEGIERQHVRDCLAELSQRYRISRGHDAYLTDVVEVNIHRTFGDGSAMRFVKYRIQGAGDIQSVTCRW